MRFQIKLCGLFLLFLMACFIGTAQEPENITTLPENAQENEACLSCHGDHKYEMYNSDSSMVITKRNYRPIDRDLYYDAKSVHREFKCTDCHSDEYSEFPHPLDIRFEAPYTCMDCHEGDDDYVQFNFEGIAEEYEQSIHHTEMGEGFNCWSCHNPHGYIMHARSDSDLKHVIKHNNNMCLSCHSDIDKFELLSDQSLVDIIGNHQWLPNQQAHFENVRCIDCHTKISDTTLVAHNIQPKEMAIKNCVDCHSQNSHLMASLYKYKSIEARSKTGFLNAVMLNDSYVIGANRNVFLNRASIAIFILTILGIAIHAILRVITSKK